MRAGCQGGVEGGAGHTVGIGISNELLSKGQGLWGQEGHLRGVSPGSGREVDILVGGVRGLLSQRVGRFVDCPQQRCVTEV